MRSMKKIIALVMVAMMLVFALAFNTFASDADYSEAAMRLGAINVMKGDKNGNLMLDQGVTRYQAALFFVQSLTGETEVEKWNAEKESTVFSDVPEYATAIDYANGIGLIRGRGDGTYGYNDPITYQDMLVLAVRALGYETESMTYPAGYLLAAKKLKLTDGLASGILNTQALTRGETAQIIWNMLGTQIAEKDPITGKLLYPNEESTTEGVVSGTIERTTLLVESGFSQGVIESVVKKYNAAKLSSDIATVELENGLVIAASDLGITARTNHATFLGLPITLYVDCAASDFFTLYDVDEEESEASIVFAETLEFTNVVNIGDQTNIKITTNTNGTQRLTLGEETFDMSKYTVNVYKLDKNTGWKLDTNSDFFSNFAYSGKEFTGANTYGEVDYAVVVDEDAKTYEVKVLYKPYEFGQYLTRGIRYQPTAAEESLIAIGKYDAAAVNDGYKNPDNKYSYFKEYLLGSNHLIDVDTESVSRSQAELAKDAKLSGESVRSGDFIFYYYNQLDNVLVIGQNCGALKGGNLTSKGDTAKTVKIDSVTYTYEIPGAFTFTGDALPAYDSAVIGGYLANIVSDEKNVQYVALDDNVLFVHEFLNGSNYRKKHNYIITTSEKEIMADLLDMDVADYEEAIKDSYGVYVSEKGNITIAVLNTTNGKWELGEIAQFECGADKNGKIAVTSTGSGNYAFNHKENKFAFKFDISEELEKYLAFGNLYSGSSNIQKVITEILKGGLFAQRAKNGNVYDVSVMFSTGDWGMIDNGIVVDGLYFSDTGNKTNKIEASRSGSVERARVTINDSTVIVVIGKDDQVGVRVGLQKAENSIIFATHATDSNGTDYAGYFYSASSKLIVLKIANSSAVTVTDNAGNPFNIKTWADGVSATADETFYVGLGHASLEYERLDDGKYELTVGGLFNLRTMRAVSAIKVTVDSLNDTDIDDAATLTGKVIEMDKRGKLKLAKNSTTNADVTVQEALEKCVNMDAARGEEVQSINMSTVEFVDDCSITVPELNLNKDDAIAEIKVKLITLDASGIDFNKYDIDSIAVDSTAMGAYSDTNAWDAPSITFARGEERYAYEIAEINAVENIKEPVAGVLDQYIIHTAGMTMDVAKIGENYFENSEKIRVSLNAVGNFDADDGVLTLYVVKLIEKAQ